MSLQAANSGLRLLPFSQAAPFIAERIRGAVRESGRCDLVLAGGLECEERARWRVASRAPEGSSPRDRVSLTLPVLNAARCVAFLVAGEDKRGALQALLAPRAADAAAVPAQRAQLHVGELFCFTDLR